MNSRILKKYRSKYSALICLNLVFGLHSVMCSAQHSHESGQKPADLSSRCAPTASRSCKVSSLTVDAAGHLWIAANGCVFKAEGGGLKPLVELPPLPTNNSSMTGITAGSAGEIYMADSEGNKVVKVSPDGNTTVVAGTGNRGFSGDKGPATDAELSGPNSVALDSEGNLYIGDQGNGRVRKVLRDGTITTVISVDVEGFSHKHDQTVVPSLFGSGPITVDPKGNLYLSHPSEILFRMTPDGQALKIAGTYGRAHYTGDGPANSAAFHPWGLAADAQENLYVADFTNRRVLKITPDGMLTTLAGNGSPGFSGDNGPANLAIVGQPSSVATDEKGNVYFMDLWGISPSGTYSCNTFVVRRVSAEDGTITTVAGGPPASPKTKTDQSNSGK